jgi:LAO/AO transport system kinase
MHGINPHLSARARKPTPSVEELVNGILSGNRVLLSQAITLIESHRADHQEKAQAVIDSCLPHAGNSIRIGITGTPGVGKSTFIETFGLRLIEKGHRVAVLAIDPSSQMTHGSILGDKTRMMRLSVHESAYIRPSPAGDALGGVARKTREAIMLCEAAGFDIIIVETVGVGQSETAVHSMTDVFLLLLMPGAGDELQGIKRGIVEMADIIAVNKADGDNALAAKRAKAFYANALHLFPPKPNYWIPQILTCSALSGDGLEEVWQLILNFQELTKNNQSFYTNRQEQAVFWLREAIDERLKKHLFDTPSVKERFLEVQRQVAAGELSPFKGAQMIVP